MEKNDINLALRNENKEELQRTQWSENLRRFVGDPPDKNRLKFLAKESGLEGTRVYITCCTAAGNDADIRRLHEIMVSFLKQVRDQNNAQQATQEEAKKEPVLESYNEQTNQEEVEKEPVLESYNEQVKSMVEEIETFIQFNPEALSQISDISGLTPGDIMQIIDNPTYSADALTVLYTTMSNLKSEQELNSEENKPKAM